MILDINGREKAKRFWIVASLLGICMFVTAIFCFFLYGKKRKLRKEWWRL